MNHRTLRRAGVVALSTVLVACTALAGCGDDDDRLVSDEPVIDRVEVTIGFAGPLTGEDADHGQGMRRAAELAFREANNTEEVLAAGYEFVLRVEDDRADPERAVEVANLFAEDSGILGVIGHLDSECSIPASAIYGEAGMAMLTFSTDPLITHQGFDVVNRIAAHDASHGSRAADLAYSDLGFTSVAVIDDSTHQGVGRADEFENAFVEAGGEIVSRETIQPGEVDVQALVTRLHDLEPEAVYYVGPDSVGGEISKQMAEDELDAQLVVGGGIAFPDEHLRIAGAQSAEGDIVMTLGVPFDEQPRGMDFSASFEAEYGVAPEAHDSYAYDAAAIFVQAVLDVGPDRDRVAGAVRGITFDGVTGVIQFDENGDTLSQVVSAYRVTDGAWQSIDE